MTVHKGSARPRRVLSGFASVLVGVWAYCLVVAPVFSNEPYLVTAAEKSRSIGVGWTVVVVVLTALWLLVLSARGRKQP